MSSLFRKMLLPGVLMVLIVQAFAIPLGYLGFRPHAYLFWHYAAFVSYWFLMPGFLVAAAMGAWYSRHQGGDFRDRLVAGTFYAIASLFACVLPLPLAFVVDPHVAWSTRFEAVTGYILSQVVVPGIPMLLGTLPFLFSKESDQVIGIRPRRKRTYFFDTSSS